MKIYLAGSVSNSNWRTGLIHNFHELSENVSDDFENGKEYWPTVPKIILGQHDFVGPYFIAGYSGCNTHSCGKHGGYLMAMDIVQLCNDAIKKCDVLYAWIDRTDIYGTIFEIGMAKALGKEVVISGPKYFSDMWFVYDNGHTIGVDEDSDNWKDKPKDMLQAYFESRVSDLKTMPYKEYLRTPHWLNVRKKALELYGYKCQICNSTSKLEVHHRTYERRGHESLLDVTVLCDACHGIFHTNGRLKP